MPATFTIAPDGPEIHFIDLDLNVRIWPDGRCVVNDEDDFARNTTVHNYPPDARTAARDAASALLSAVSARHAPIDQIGLSLLP